MKVWGIGPFFIFYRWLLQQEFAFHSTAAISQSDLCHNVSGLAVLLRVGAGYPYHDQESRWWPGGKFSSMMLIGNTPPFWPPSWQAYLVPPSTSDPCNSYGSLAKGSSAVYSSAKHPRLRSEDNKIPTAAEYGHEKQNSTYGFDSEVKIVRPSCNSRTWSEVSPAPHSLFHSSSRCQCSGCNSSSLRLSIIGVGGLVIKTVNPGWAWQEILTIVASLFQSGPLILVSVALLLKFY